MNVFLTDQRECRMVESEWKLVDDVVCVLTHLKFLTLELNSKNASLGDAFLFCDSVLLALLQDDLPLASSYTIYARAARCIFLQ